MSSSSSTSNSDPNGWIKSPPSTFVTVHGTSRDSINGARGLVISYDGAKSRYLILLVISQQQVSLKVDNLKVVGMIDQARAYMELLQHSPEVQRQVQRFGATIRHRTNNRIEPKYLLIGMGILTILACVFLGITKTFLLLSLLVLFLMVVFEDVMNTSLNTMQIVRNVPNRWRSFCRENIPSIGNTIADNNLYLMAFTGLVALFTVLPLFKTGGANSSPNREATATATSTSSTHSEPEYFYKLGYDDAKANLDFGSSLSSTTTQRSLIDDYDDGTTDWLPPTKSSSSPFSISTAMAVFAIVRTIYPLGHDGTARWNYRLALASLQTLPTWRMALLGFAVYRLVAAFV